jgi:NTE family protein
MRFRDFAPGTVICREGAPGQSMLVVVEGIAHELVALPDDPKLRSRSVFDEGRLVAKLRRGDVIGVDSLLTGEPQGATVKAATATAALELGEADFRALIATSPKLLVNLTRILSGRLAAMTRRHSARGQRGEAVALVVGPSLAAAVPDILAATAAASPEPVHTLDATDSVERALDELDEALEDNRTVVLATDLDPGRLALLVEHVDRAVVVLAEDEEQPPEVLTAGAPVVELALVKDSGARPVNRGPIRDGVTLVRELARDGDGPGGLRPPDVAWVGRHLARTKLGLALGAGGAKGFAHVGALRALEEAGYVIDYVGGASIGAIVGSYVALGMDADEIDRTMRESFDEEAVAKIFTLSLAGTSTGVDEETRIFKETTRELRFDQAELPLVCMAVDLTAREPAPLCEGPIWEALIASTALAGMFPPATRDGHRLVDGVALIPVPTGAVADAGADVTLSVNLMSQETLAAWPGQAAEPPPPEKSGSRMLETLLEVMDLSQLEASVKHAALADVVVTPRFGPGSWRDFGLADLFLAAGRQAAEEQIPALGSLARPQSQIAG